MSPITWKQARLWFLVSFVCLAPSLATPAQPEAYGLAVSARQLSRSEVELTIETNIPLPVEVMAGLSLADQGPNDIYIGHDERIKLDQPITRYVLNLSNTDPELPNGIYDAEVAFYSRWGAQGNAKAANVPDMTGTFRLNFAGSGETADQVASRLGKQKWVMENIYMNFPWNERDFVKRLGRYEKRPSALSPLHDAYYFPDADITLLVNHLKHDVTVWRLGKATR